MVKPNAAKATTLAAIGKEMPLFARDLAMDIMPALLLEMEPSSEKVLVLEEARRALQLVSLQPLPLSLEAMPVLDCSLRRTKGWGLATSFFYGEQGFDWLQSTVVAGGRMETVETFDSAPMR
jgi:hypothetical protein